MKIFENKRAICFFLLPGMIFYTIIVILPVFLSVYYSFFSWSGIGKMTFTGVDNFARLIHDQIFLRALKNNLSYILIVVGIQIVLGFLLAILLVYCRRGRALVQTLFFVPSVITVIAIAQLFRSFYSVLPQGLFNMIITTFGGESIDFLAQFNTVLPAVSAVEGWQYIGIYMVIFYAALVSVSEDIVEAARIDGAGEIRVLWSIRLPNIKNVIGLSLILSIVGALRGFASIMNLTKGGPSNRSEILSTYLYKTAFTNMEMGYGSAIGVVIIFISLICIFMINRFTSERK